MDLSQLHPELLSSWDSEKNSNFNIHNVRAKDKVWWICEKWHEWEAIVDSRKRWIWCPYCANQKLLKWYNDLATTNPEIAKEWNYERNSLKPYEVFECSNKKARRKCEKWHEREAKISNRTSTLHLWCPYCSNKAILKWYNDLATTNPEIAKEWNYEKNSLTPYEISEGSDKKVRRKCEKWHEWESRLSSRTYGKNPMWCPYCSNQKILKWYNDLATTNPEIARQWNYEKNWNITPDMINEGSNRKFWWKCEKGHEWNAKVESRKRWYWCPYCANQKVLKWFNDLATTNPELMDERDFEKNEKLWYSPYKIPRWASINVWWKCKKWHEWKAVVFRRTVKKGNWCPHCAKWLHISFPEKTIYYYLLKIDKNIVENYRDESIWLSELDIFIPQKRIAIEYDGQAWHQNKKRDITKNNICKDNNIKLFRVRESECPKLNSSSIDFYVKAWDFTELQHVIKSLVLQIFWKSICVDIDKARFEILKMMDLSCEKSAEVLPYEILKERDIEKNNGLLPTSFSIGSNRKVWWKCENWHNYEASIVNRKNWRWCPYCNSHKLLVWFNDLKSRNPELANEWNYEKNWNLKPDWVFEMSWKKVRWKCKKWHERETAICNRSKWSWCPYCAGKIKE